MKALHITLASLLLALACGCVKPDDPVTPTPTPEPTSFCGAVGTEGCTAIRFDSSIVAAWATGCTVVRGPVDITDPDGPRVRYGDPDDGTGPAGTSQFI